MHQLQIIPFAKSIVRALVPSLDDRKRLVRQEAVKCRGQWSATWDFVVNFTSYATAGSLCSSCVLRGSDRGSALFNAVLCCVVRIAMIHEIIQHGLSMKSIRRGSGNQHAYSQCYRNGRHSLVKVPVRNDDNVCVGKSQHEHFTHKPIACAHHRRDSRSCRSTPSPIPTVGGSH